VKRLEDIEIEVRRIEDAPGIRIGVEDSVRVFDALRC
jgi:hypothetical protein